MTAITPFANLPSSFENADTVELDVAGIHSAPPLSSIEIDLSQMVESETTRLDLQRCLRPVEASLAPRSQSNLYVGFDGNRPEGVFMATYAALALESDVHLVLHIPGHCELHLRAVVEWSRDSACADGPPGVGLRFQHLSEGEEALLRNYLQHREPIFHVM